MTKSDTRFDVSWDRSAISPTGDTVVLMLRILPAVRPQTTQRSSSPVDVAFALDRSGSMSGQPIELVKKAVQTGSSLLSDHDRLALVVYDDRIDVIHPLQPVNNVSRLTLRTALAGVDARGSTNLGEGWLQAGLQLADSAPMPSNGRTRLQRTMLLTDGLANVGITDAGDLARHAAELRRRGITTSTMGVGDHFDEMLLSAMAEAGGGNFEYIPSASHLPDFFKKELGRLLSTVVSALTLTVRTQPGVETDVLSSFPNSAAGNDRSITVGEIAQGDETIVLVSVATPASTVGQTVRVNLTVNWIDPATSQPHSSVIETPALTVVPASSPLLAERDEAVAEQTALQQAARNQREAMRLDREGRHAESRSLHSRIARDLAAAPATARVRERFQEAETYGSYAADRAMPESMRKQAVHDSFRRERGRSDNS